MKVNLPALLYYCRVNRDDKANIGVIKKCQAQANGFRQLGYEVDMVWLCKDGILLNNDLTARFQKSRKPKSLRTYFFYFFFWHPELRRLLKGHNYEVVYARYELAHPSLLQFFRFLKRNNPLVQIILEIPTYPYKKELIGPLRKLQLLIDWMCRGSLRKYVDRVVNFGQEKIIHGIPTLSLANGIDLEKIPISSSEVLSGKLRLLAIGNWRYWHGLDRLIRGIADYYKGGENKVIVSLHIIGLGADLPQVLGLAKELDISQYLITSSPLDGIDLDRAFEEADIGVGDLASFRKGLSRTSSLKHREYCARALPFILSTPDDDFPTEIFWVKYIKNDERPVPIEKVVYFFKEVSKCNNRQAMRAYANEKLSWKAKLEPLTQYLRQRLGTRV